MVQTGQKMDQKKTESNVQDLIPTSNHSKSQSQISVPRNTMNNQLVQKSIGSRAFEIAKQVDEKNKHTQPIVISMAKNQENTKT